MTEKRYDEYRRKCAEIDGIELPEFNCNMDNECYYDCLSLWEQETRDKLRTCHTYLLDGEIDAVVRKLDEEQIEKYSKTLCEIVLDTGCTIFKLIHRKLQATPEQKSEALARTLMGGKE